MNRVALLAVVLVLVGAIVAMSELQAAPSSSSFKLYSYDTSQNDDSAWPITQAWTATAAAANFTGASWKLRLAAGQDHAYYEVRVMTSCGGASVGTGTASFTIRESSGWVWYTVPVQGYGGAVPFGASCSTTMTVMKGLSAYLISARSRVGSMPHAFVAWGANPSSPGAPVTSPTPPGSTPPTAPLGGTPPPPTEPGGGLEDLVIPGVVILLGVAVLAYAGRR